jgi:ABC-type sugar transport system permease subunit
VGVDFNSEFGLINAGAALLGIESAVLQIRRQRCALVLMSLWTMGGVMIIFWPD